MRRPPEQVYSNQRWPSAVLNTRHIELLRLWLDGESLVHKVRSAQAFLCHSSFQLHGVSVRRSLSSRQASNLPHHLSAGQRQTTPGFRGVHPPIASADRARCRPQNPN
ncbi:hypothetical protein Bbelb_420170 [Branchiostoma belcheri]|nr:hypothetical protein Bbelb_420170 [Branchiostoma belcheri]